MAHPILALIAGIVVVAGIAAIALNAWFQKLETGRWFPWTDYL